MSDCDDFDECDDFEADDTDDEERCDSCLMYGEAQCDEHGPPYIAMMEEEASLWAVGEAIETLLSLRASRSGPEWEALIAAAELVHGRGGRE